MAFGHNEPLNALNLRFKAFSGELGEKSQALAWLDKAYEERSGSLPLLKVNPIWDPLRSDPRFAEFLFRVGPPQ